MLALTAALVAPFFIDWDSYRADFEREASAILGRKVTVKGEASARILPLPSLTFTDVVVGEGPIPVASIEEFSMDAELAPLLAGEFVIFDMRVVRPRANLGMDANGRLDLALSPTGPFDPRNIKLENMKITEGRISIRDAIGDREHLLTEINADVSARSLRGPWRIDGSMRVNGLRTDISISTGTVAETGSMRARITARPAIYTFELETDGDVTLAGGKPRYEGTFRLAENTQRTAELRGTDGETIKTTTAKAPPAYRVSGKFAANDHRVDVPEYRLETGPLADPYTADGNAFLQFGADPRFSVKADGAQVRFDDALDVSGQGSGLTLKDRVLAIHNALIDFPRPTIPGTIEIDVPAVVAGDTTIRDVKMSAEPAANGWNIKTLSATLPGRTTLEGDGLLRTGETDFGFSGNLLIAVGQPSGFAAWLSKDVDDAIRKLPAAGFGAKVDMTPTRQTFRDIELQLGKARFTGELDNVAAADARPSLSLKLDGEALDVDGLAAFASLFVSDAGDARFADRDVDLDVTVGPVTASGLTADTVDTTMRLRGGTLEIDKLAITGLGGASVSATGSVKDFAGSPTGNFDASVVAADLAPLFTLLGAQYPESGLLKAINARTSAYPGLFEDSQLDMVFTAVRNDDRSTGVALSARGKSGGTNFTVSGSGNGDLGQLDAAKFKLSVAAEATDAGSLLALYGLRSLPLGTVGSGQTNLVGEGSVKDGFAAVIDFNGADMQAQFDGFIAPGAEGPSAKGSVRLEAADIEPWLLTTGLALPGMGIGLPVSLIAYADLANGTLAISGIDGEVADGPLTGEIAAVLKDGLPHLTGSIGFDALDIAQLAALTLGDAAFGSGEEGADESPFATKVIPPFTADMTLKAASFAAGPLGAIEDAELKARVEKDGFRLTEINGTLDGGKVEGLVELKNTAGNALLTTQFGLTNADLAALLGGAAIGGRVDLTASLSASGKTPGALVASLAGSGTASLRSVSLPGINPHALAPIIAEADRIGREVSAEQVAAFAPAIIGNGTFTAATGDVAFTVASGVLRAPPLSLVGPKADVKAELRFNAATTETAATGSITYDAGDQALIGSEPVVDFRLAGPLGAGVLTFNTEPLAQFLAQRALEKEQDRVEGLQSALIEKQRLRREVRYYAALRVERDKAAEQLKQDDAARKAEEDAARIQRERAEAEEATKRLAEQNASETEPAGSGAEPAPLVPPVNGTDDPLATFDPKRIQDMLQTLEP